jgi:photosystem II stability/assembly factor-like uncharacterized protein
MQDKRMLYRRYADLLSVNSSPELAQLIADLDMIYTIDEPPDDLARNIAQSLATHSNKQRSATTRTQPAKRGGIPQTHPALYRRKAWQRSMSTLAAVFLTLLLVGSLLVVLNLIRQGRTGGGGNAPHPIVPTAAAGSSLSLNQLHMIDSMNGWAWAENERGKNFTVLHTNDGGYHWKMVSPGRQTFGEGSWPYFLTGSLAWVIVPQTAGHPALLFRTTNAGQTWNQTTLPAENIGAASFINAQTGWVTSNVVMGGRLSAVEIFHTIDGGQNWTRVVTSSAANSNHSGSLPFNNAIFGMQFSNETTGWITGASNANNDPYLYVTHDSGHTWHQQMLPAPEGVPPPDAGMVIWKPQFFSTRDGILPVSFWSPSGLDVYVTHDRGESWQSTSFLPVTNTNVDMAASTGDPMFVDMTHGWLEVNQAHPMIYMTGDGGQHWGSAQYSLPFALPVLDFVSGRIGWAIGNAGNGATELFKTINGGKSWMQIRFIIS